VALSTIQKLGTSRRASVSIVGSRGILARLWDMTSHYAPAGDIGKFADSAIAKHIDWKKKARRVDNGVGREPMVGPL
jgi:hypothetical protein